MKKKFPTPLDKLLKEYVAAFKIEDKLDEVELIRAWPKVVDRNVLGQTYEISYSKGTLTVKLGSAALKADLFMRKSSVIKSLNEVCGAQIVKELVIK